LFVTPKRLFTMTIDRMFSALCSTLCVTWYVYNTIILWMVCITGRHCCVVNDFPYSVVSTRFYTISNSTETLDNRLTSNTRGVAQFCAKCAWNFLQLFACFSPLSLYVSCDIMVHAISTVSTDSLIRTELIVKRNYVKPTRTTRSFITIMNTRIFVFLTSIQICTPASVRYYSHIIDYYTGWSLSSTFLREFSPCRFLTHLSRAICI